jgi:hypothetical protein
MELAGLGMLFYLSGCSPGLHVEITPNPVMVTPMDNPIDTDKLTRTYNDAEGWFSLRYPEDWHIKGVGSEVQFRADADNTIGMAVSLWSKTISPDMLLREVASVLDEKSTQYKAIS